MDFSVAIVAGGKSSRMGRDKAFVPLRGRPMIHHVLERVTPLGAKQVLIVANRPADYSSLRVPVFSDVLPDKGALGGIYTALTYSPSDYTLIVACDMPFLNTALLHRLIGFCQTADENRPDVIVPVFNNRPQGLHAVYRKTCLAPIRARLEGGLLKVIAFYPDVTVRYVMPEEYRDLDPDGWSFRNINTPDELNRAESEAGPDAQ